MMPGLVEHPMYKMAQKNFNRPFIPNDFYLYKIKQRFTQYTRRADNGCLEWTGALAAGYGNINVNYTRVGAHILAIFLRTGEWPIGVVCHKCDNKKCCEYNHLFVGTYSDNMQDSMIKGVKFGPKTVVAAWQEEYILNHCDMSNQKIADNIDLTRETVRRVKIRNGTNVTARRHN